MSDWETYGYRVTWLESHPFAGREPDRREATVETSEDVLYLLDRIRANRAPGCDRPTYGAEVFELQRRTETREKPCGLAGWSR